MDETNSNDQQLNESNHLNVMENIELQDVDDICNDALQLVQGVNQIMGPQNTTSGHKDINNVIPFKDIKNFERDNMNDEDVEAMESNVGNFIESDLSDKDENPVVKSDSDIDFQPHNEGFESSESEIDDSTKRSKRLAKKRRVEAKTRKTD